MTIYIRPNVGEEIKSRCLEKTAVIPKQTLTRPVGLKLTICVSLILAACSKTTFLYNQIDRIIPWYLGRYVDLDQGQTRQLQSLLDPFLFWHRTEELPEYQEILESFLALLGDEVVARELERIQNKIEIAWIRLESRSLDWLLPIGGSLSEKQVNSFFHSLEDQQRKYEKKYLIRTDARYRKDARKELTDVLKKYLGPLDRRQNELVFLAVKELKRSDRIWLRERAIWTKRIQTILDRQPGWQNKIKTLLLEREKNLSQEYLAIYDWNTAVIRSVLVQLLNSLSKKQDYKLRKEINRWRGDIHKIISQRQHDS